LPGAFRVVELADGVTLEEARRQTAGLLID
jgi:hypothetical protein